MSDSKILVEKRGHVLLMGINRPEKRNALTLDMYFDLARAYGELDRNPELRCGLLYAGRPFYRRTGSTPMGQGFCRRQGGFGGRNDSRNPGRQGSDSMKQAEVVIIGGGPAGLCAAVSAAKSGSKVLIIDKNKKLGGQLIKQTHMFFGSEK